MSQVEVEITGQAITARYGTLNTGDILRTDAEFARHLVEDCSAAKYTKPKVNPVVDQKPTSKVVNRKKPTEPVAPAAAVETVMPAAPTEQANPDATDPSAENPQPPSA